MRYASQLSDSKSEALRFLRGAVQRYGIPVLEAERRRKTSIASAAIAVRAPDQDIVRVIAAPEVGGLCLAIIVHWKRASLGLSRALALVTVANRAKHGRLNVPVVSWLERVQLERAPDMHTAPFPPVRYVLYDPGDRVGGLPTTLAVGLWGDERALGSNTLLANHEKSGFETSLPPDHVLDLHLTLSSHMAMAHGMRMAGAKAAIVAGPLGLARRARGALLEAHAKPELPRALEELLDSLD